MSSNILNQGAQIPPFGGDGRAMVNGSGQDPLSPMMNNGISGPHPIVGAADNQSQGPLGNQPLVSAGPALPTVDALSTLVNGLQIDAQPVAQQAPPMLPASFGQPPAPVPVALPSSSNVMTPFNPSFNHGAFGGLGGEFDFGPELDFAQLTSEFFPGDMEHILNMGLNEWPDDDVCPPPR